MTLTHTHICIHLILTTITIVCIYDDITCQTPRNNLWAIPVYNIIWHCDNLWICESFNQWYPPKLPPGVSSAIFCWESGTESCWLRLSGLWRTRQANYITLTYLITEPGYDKRHDITPFWYILNHLKWNISMHGENEENHYQHIHLLLLFIQFARVSSDTRL